MSVLPQEGAAAQDDIPVVEDGGLAGSHSPLGLVEAETDSAAIQGDRLGVLLPLAVAELHPAADGPGRGFPGDPVEVPRQGLPAVEGLLRPQDNGVALRAEAADIAPLRQGEPQSPVLAHGIADEPPVPPQDSSLRGNEVPGLRRMPGLILDDPGVVSVRDEADVLAVRLAGVAEARFLRQVPDGLLAELPQGKRIRASWSWESM